MNEQIQRVVRAHREGGVARVLQSARGRIRPEQPYQRKVATGRETRWAMYEAAIPADASNLLDVGCNLGEHTAHFASRGLLSLGIDVSADLVRAASRRHADTSGCGFMHLDIDQQAVAQLPSYDVVLVLSVHHHWVNAYGPDGAGDILAALLQRTNTVMIFEGAARKVRYGAHAPDFVDNDEGSVTSYLETYLKQHLGNSTGRIEPLGKAPAVGEREPFRWSWAIYR